MEMKYRVSHYEEYPIFEPAEGGYYYAGAEVTSYQEFAKLKDARAYMAEVEKDLKTEGVWGRTYVGTDSLRITGKRIGEDEYWVLEGTKKNPINGRVSGKQVYC